MAGDFVGDGVGEAGEVFYAIGGVGLVGDNFDGVAYLRLGDVGDVDGYLVHAYAAADGGGFSVDVDNGAIGEGAEVAVAVADGNDGDAAVV